MANLNETDEWFAGIYQLEEDDPVLGGPAGIDNLAPRQLASRSLYQRLRNVTPWSALLAYPADTAYVSHAGTTWKSVAASTGVQPGTDEAKWTRWAFTQAELDAALGDAVADHEAKPDPHPQYAMRGAIDAGEIVTGTLPVERGGTGRAVVTAGNFLRGNGTGALVERTPAQVATDIGVQAAIDATALRRDGTLPMTGALQAKQGAPTANNVNNAGYTFNVDFDSGMFSPSDGVLQLVTNGIVFMQNSANGYCQFLKGVRAPKGGPGGNDASNVSGFTFQEDGDTGMFAVGGNNAAGSDLVFYVDAVEAGRIKQAMRGGTSNGWSRSLNGIIFQWGQITQADNGSAQPFTITLPVAFPNSALQAYISPGTGVVGASPSMGTVEGQSTTQLTGYTLGPAANRVWRWFAIGA